jgi:23S rRNA maturation-related 3'-5' exoribonuclease YhaM
MSNVAEARKLVQDLLAPDVKALAVRIEALEAEVKLRFTSAEEVAKARHEAVLANIAASHASIMGALEMEKRVTKLETQQQIERRA